MFDQGLYKARCRGTWGLTESQNGNLQFVIDVDIVGRAKNDRRSEEGYDDLKEVAKRTVMITFTDASKNIAFSQLAALGFEGKPLSKLEKGSEGAHDFEGFEFPIYCKIEEWKGRDRERWTPSKARPINPARVRRNVEEFSTHFENYEKAVRSEKEPWESSEEATV